MKTVFMFPGQGSQQPGMAADLATRSQAIQFLFRDADHIVGFPLSHLCFEGPAEKLDTTAASQPAIFLASVACLAAIRSGLAAPQLTDVEPDACLGLSLGEYTALYAAGALSFAEALRLVQVRGEAMQAAADQNPGGMVSLLGLDEPAVHRLCAAVLKERPVEPDGVPAVLLPVNFNCPGQIVLSGTRDACRLAAQLAEKSGARAVPLRVAGAFHTSLMVPAAERLEAALESCSFSDPECPVLANVDAEPYHNAAQIPPKLLAQLTSPIRWQQSIERLLGEGCRRFIEIGPGRVLAGLVKKIARAARAKPEIINVSGLPVS